MHKYFYAKVREKTKKMLPYRVFQELEFLKTG